MLTEPMRRALPALAFLMGAALSPAAVTAETASATQREGEPSTIRLSLTRDGSAVPRTAVLKCHPAGGNHDHAAEACTQLERANGNFAYLQAGESRACTLEYDPVTVTATGNWRGSPVHFEETFSNTCMLTARTGVVFDL